MAVSKNRNFAKIANDVGADGTLTAEGISSDVTLGGATIYATRSVLPVSGNTAGDQAYVTENNRLYIWNGSGWYNVALLNLAPSITSVQDSDGGTTPFTLSIDGTATTITITATDSDSDPITYNATADSDFAGLATISQADNVFTITPFSQDSATTQSGTITFTASDGVNLGTSGVQTFRLNFLSALWDETVLSIGTSSTNGLNNSTFIDRSTNAHTVTPTGSPVQTAFHPYLDNWSVEFTEDTMTIPSSAEFNVGNGDFTFETWINTTRNSGTIFDFGGNYLITYNGFNTTFTSDGYLKMTLNQQSNGDAGQYILTGSTKINDGKWNHIRITRTGTTFRFFVNGVLDVSGTSSVTGYQAGSAFVIGGSLSNNSPTSGLTGHLADFRLIKGTSLNTTDDSFDVPTENLTNVPGTSLLLFNRNRFVDLSSTGHSLTINGAKVSAFNPFGQQSEYASGENKGSVVLEGSTSYLRFPVTSFTGDYTLECWVYKRDSDKAQVWAANYPTDGNFQWFIETNNKLDIYPTSMPSSGTIRLNEWVHLVYQRRAGTLEYFINGVKDAVTTSSNTTSRNLSAVGGNLGQLDGYIADAKATIGSAVYTSNFTPPVTPAGGTSAYIYLPMDNAGIFDKTGNNTLTLYGNTSTSTTQTKFADTAMYFDGSGDYITTDFPALGTGDFTIEFWINPSTIDSNYKALFDTRTSNANNPLVWIRNTNVIYYYSGAADRIIGTTTLSTSTWYHVTVCRSSGTTKLFLNGTQEGSDYSNTASYTADTLFIGQRFNASPTYYYHGYIENLQVLKGVAKYTANFTPPTQEQGRGYQAES